MMANYYFLITNPNAYALSDAIFALKNNVLDVLILIMPLLIILSITKAVFFEIHRIPYSEHSETEMVFIEFIFYTEKNIRIPFINKRILRSEKRNLPIDSLSDSGQKKIKKEIEASLKKIYLNVSKSESAKEQYILLQSYMEVIFNDLQKAIGHTQIDDENLLFSNLHEVKELLKWIDQSVAEAKRRDDDEFSLLKEIKREEQIQKHVEDFSTVSALNELLEI